MTGREIVQPGRLKSKRKWMKDLKKNGEMLLMCLPAIIKIFIFSYLPIFGVVIAFKKYIPAMGIWGSEWVGFKNFEFFFTSKSAWLVLRNTLTLNLISIVLSLGVNVVLALILYEITKKFLLKFYQTVLFIPYFFSWVLIGLMLTVLISPTTGVLTKLIIDLTGNEVDFYSNPSYWRFILPVISVWKGAGFGSLIYYSALMGLDREYFEAAEIDGAGKLQRIWHICIPSLIPMICVLTIMNIGNIIKADFGMFYFVPRNQSRLYPVTDVIDTFVYRALAENGDFGMSSAVGLFQSVVGLVMVLLTNKAAKSVDRDYSLF